MAGGCSSQLGSPWVLLRVLEETSSIWAILRPPSRINAFTDGVSQGFLTFVPITEQPSGKHVRCLCLKHPINANFFHRAEGSAKSHSSCLFSPGSFPR